jgi:hypothetical protein
MSYLLFYIPLCLAVLIVLEMCKEQPVRAIWKRTLKNFVLLTACLAAGSGVVYALHLML